MLAKDRVSRPSVAGLDRSCPAMCARCMQAPMSRTRSHSRCRGWNQKSERWSAWEKKIRRRVRMGITYVTTLCESCPTSRCKQAMQAAKRAFVSSRVIQTKPLRVVFLTYSVHFTLSLRSSSLAEQVPANVPSSLCIFPEHIYFRVRRVRYHPHELEHNLKFSRKNLCPFTCWSPSSPDFSSKLGRLAPSRSIFQPPLKLRLLQIDCLQILFPICSSQSSTYTYHPAQCSPYTPFHSHLTAPSRSLARDPYQKKRGSMLTSVTYN